jgi:hypothetical protein
MKADGPPGASSNGFNENLTLFASGKAAMWNDATSLGGPLFDKTQSQVADKVAFANAPIAVTPNGSRWLWSDRLRYYWPDPSVEASFQILVKNLSEPPPPLSLLSQFAPSAFRAIRNGELSNDPLSIIRHRIQEVLGMYARACGMSQTQGG